MASLCRESCTSNFLPCRPCLCHPFYVTSCRSCPSAIAATAVDAADAELRKGPSCSGVPRRTYAWGPGVISDTLSGGGLEFGVIYRGVAGSNFECFISIYRDPWIYTLRLLLTITTAVASSWEMCCKSLALLFSTSAVQTCISIVVKCCLQMLRLPATPWSRFVRACCFDIVFVEVCVPKCGTVVKSFIEAHYCGQGVSGNDDIT